MPSDNPVHLDLFAAHLVQKLLRIQYLEDLAAIRDDPYPRKPSRTVAAITNRYKSLGLSDVSLGEVRDIRQARTSEKNEPASFDASAASCQPREPKSTAKDCEPDNPRQDILS